ncbi:MULTISPECIES: hypothetical protein [Streptomyces]|uniref:Secreted protein n=2 Tax=Streptomyces TaxID=1883 RepID=A0A3R7EZW3_9ACTN|nr:MULTISPECIES: hypothetical protein [Streptomyces]KNE80565.1 hypothetical protein ADZ36_21310 [Streptomyces fradiae]OFA41596.1 hypothetical protein BEN35_24385 [Streptomyces fradiae]PQM25340.1 hypothetical protein Sfr7A_04225 [Streptomyces xinghaiensis]RKM99394.1 hypothetical protein SFRA_004225 [Streptomyces xinghaiensis]RNC75702.1 hypothetical protein DC095_000150 [Streptomyces xinghaiensis]
MCAPCRHPLATVLIAAVLLVSPVAAAAALAAGKGPAGADGRERLSAAALRPSGRTAEGERRREYRAGCRTEIEGSQATVYCHNPYPVVDRVRLHVECEQWWDLDADTRPVEIGPAQTAELTARCWKTIGRAWVTHDVVR